MRLVHLSVLLAIPILLISKSKRDLPTRVAAVVVA
jgi:hypothetical protein